MNKQVVSILNDMWKRFEFLFASPGQPASWRQEPYRTDFFNAFARVYRIEPMHGDQVRAFLRERHLSKDDRRYDEKLRVMSKICDAWSEWNYAWKNYPQQ